MLLSARQLWRLPVFTQSGIRLGRISDFQLEVETQSVLQYEVRWSLWRPPLLVSREQVISIDARRLVVEDAVVPAREGANLAIAKPAREEQSAALPSGGQ